MGRIHVLPEHVANKIAAGEVVERPASVVKELLENSLDAGARRIRVQTEAGGKKLVQVVDDGCGMGRDDALLAFERHATSKIKNAEDLLNIATLGFRGEALPSIASVSRFCLETRSADEATGSIIEISGGKLIKVEEAGLPLGSSIIVRDLFFNMPARKKFLRAESTELSHIASLVTHYALAHPDKHFELHSATNSLLIAAPVRTHGDRIYQIFGKQTLDQLLPLAAAARFERTALPAPPPWRRDDDYEPPPPGEVRIHGFVSRPEIQKLNRNSIFVFVNQRLVRDRLIQHALTDAYRNILPPTVFPVVLLFIELPPTEVDANVHPSKIEIRFRQPAFIHDFVRDSVRATLMKARPMPQFTTEIHAQPTASSALSPNARAISLQAQAAAVPPFGHPPPAMELELQPPTRPAFSERLAFDGSIAIEAKPALANARGLESAPVFSDVACGSVIPIPPEQATEDAFQPASLAPLGQLRDSFILAVNEWGLWIIDQHVAHERVLFEKLLRQRADAAVETQRLLIPSILELLPSQMAIFNQISDELRCNGFEVEPFGMRTIAVKMAPAGVGASEAEDMLHELLEQVEREQQAVNLERVRTRITASIACHAAIKVNTALETEKMEWLLAELAKTECPMTCPHGRPVMLRYSLKDIQRAFKRI